MRQFWGVTLVKRFFSLLREAWAGFPDVLSQVDLLCVFDGGDMPFLIRPRNEEPGKLSFAYWYRRLSGYQSPSMNFSPDTEYVLVGQCYVQGLMGGEALERTDLESKFITLS